MATAAEPPTGLATGAVEPPADIPSDIFEAALATYLDCRRLDMRALAGELGISRATLYRHAGGRDRLLGEVIWFRTRQGLALAAESTRHLKGEKRVMTVVKAFMRGVHEAAPVRRLLEAEPETALRILTSKHSPVQRGVIDALERLIAREEERGELRTGVDPGALAYAIVRIGESFLYADVIADNDPDVEAAVTLVARLLRAE
jgi:AcrR family transcriptional regulator